jgi:flavin-dependent dehydrogenase
VAADSSSGALIAGASFAGLAAAQQLGDRARLVDGDEVGAGQTSACAAPVRVLEDLGAAESIQEIHHDLVIHTPGRQIHWPVPEPFCTFDYRDCCRAAFARTGARFVRASVHGHRAGAALTSAGEMPARALIDATGWRSALARPGASGPVDRNGAGGRAGGAARHNGMPAGRYFGLEAEVPASFPSGLHFYFWPDIVRDGYAWAFPAGRVARVGVLSYRGRSALGSHLDRFLSRLRMPPGPRHGGFLATRLGPPVADGVFVVGDAAGHCLPFSGEGIRSAIWAGRVCGGLLSRTLDGELAESDAAARYTAYTLRQRRRYRVLEFSTFAALTLPARVLGFLAAWVSRPRPLRVFMRHYLSMFAPEDSAVPAAGAVLRV